jgi:hypothetical protein
MRNPAPAAVPEASVYVALRQCDQPLRWATMNKRRNGNSVCPAAFFG